MFKRLFKRKSKGNGGSSRRASVKSTASDIQLEDEKQRLVSRRASEKFEEYDDLSFIVDYIGSDYISEAQSVPLLVETLKRIKKQHPKTTRVDLVLKSGVLKVIDNEKRALLITAPLYAIALAAQEQLRGFETAFALNITRRRIHMCHVFQTGSRLEAAAIVRAIALSFRSVAKDLKEKHEDSSIERIRSDSDYTRSESDLPCHRSRNNEGREFDAIARRRNNKLIGLPTLPSEENLDTMLNHIEEKNQTISVMVHQQQDESFEQGTSTGSVSDFNQSMTNEVEDGTEKGQEWLCERAIHAIRQHDMKLLQIYIDDGLSVDSADANHLSLLHHAVINHDVNITEYLLEKGADANKEGQKDQTPLHFAAAEGDRAITKVLLAHGANPRAKDSYFRTPLHLCASCLQSLEVSFVLVEHGARIEDNDIEGVRPVDLHHDLREMQNRLIQSNTEAFASAEIDRSRSNSNCSSTSGSNRSVPRSPSYSKRGGGGGGGYNKLVRSNSMRLRTSSSLQSIQDVSDGDSLLSPLSFRKEQTKSDKTSEMKACEEKDALSTFSCDRSKQSDVEAFSDPVNSGYSSVRRDSTTDSEFECQKETFFSDDVIGVSDSDEDSMKHMRMNIIDQKILHPVRLSIPGSFAKLPRKNAATTALDLLVTLSGNCECQSSILAHLCLPKASQQLVNLAHSVISNTNNLQQISRLLHNLFTVSGPTGRKKCIDAGLLKTVIDLLDAAEPVQSTCLSILNDLLHTENERDYSGTMAGIPIEPLLTIIKTSDSSHVEDLNLKLKISRSSDSGYANSSTFTERSSSLRKRPDIDMSADKHVRVASLPRSKSRSALKSDQIPLISLDSVGRGRSKSFSSSDVFMKRDSIPFIKRSSASRSSDSDSKEACAGTSGSGGSSGQVNSRTRKISRGSNGSVEGGMKTSTKPTSIVARHVAMKMLAASSRSYKLQEELSKPQILKLLLGCLDDPEDEVVLQATATLSNIAMKIETHDQIQEGNIDKGLLKLLNHDNPRIQYQAARGLVYMGHPDPGGLYIYNYISEEEIGSTVIFMEDDGKTFIRGTSVENLVLTLTKTKDIFLLWGGSEVSPPPSNQKKASSRHQTNKSRLKAVPTEYQIMNFVLSTYQTFVHPIIFMRLLLHRFRDPDAYNTFRCLHDDDAPHMEHYAPLPVIHARLMRVWIAWLENYPEDFVNFPTVKKELSELISPMRCIDGPYAPCANRLEIMLSRTVEANVHSNVYRFESESHHNILYDQCYKAITSGKIPCSDEDFVYLAGLQLYIEDLCEYGQDFPQRLNTIESITNSRLKQSIGSSTSFSKQLLKKIRSHYEGFLLEQPTERNAKHNYVDCCQGMEGYGCTFFRVKQRIPGNRSRKKVYITRLFGINSKRIVLLDERSKVSVEKFNPKYLNKWEPFEDSLTVKMHFKTRRTEKSLEMQLDNRLGFKELSNHILTCKMELNFQGYQNIDTNPWSRLAEELRTWGNMALQLHTNKSKAETIDEPIFEEPRRERSTTTTAFPMTGITHSATVSSSFVPKNYSRSAPAKQETGWSAQEVLSFLNLRSILRRGDPIVSMSPTSPTNSESGTPPKEGEDLGDSFSESPPQRDLIIQSYRRESRGSNLIGHDTMPMIDEMASERPGDRSPTDFPKYGHTTKMLTCHCPPDADFPYLNLGEFSAFELLDHPKELARQITLIDHKMFCAITSKDVMLKISFGLIKRFQKADLHVNVEKIAHRFNQMSNWIVSSIVSERNIHRRAKLFINFIETAKQCLELRNYNAVTAIVVAALNSAPVRRLEGTKELIPPEYLSWMHKMENLMDSRGNHKKYRETLRTSPTPTVPYFGIYLKDLTFISDGNPDYLKGGVINLSKRRQVYVLLEEIHRFQKKRYNFQEVTEIKDYLLNKTFMNDEQLHLLSKRNEPTIQSRLGSPTPPVLHYNHFDRRTCMQSNLFRYNNSGNTRLSVKRNQQRSGTSATSV